MRRFAASRFKRVAFWRLVAHGNAASGMCAHTHDLLLQPKQSSDPERQLSSFSSSEVRLDIEEYLYHQDCTSISSEYYALFINAGLPNKTTPPKLKPSKSVETSHPRATATVWNPRTIIVTQPEMPPAVKYGVVIEYIPGQFFK
jgi:hypothetical protein